MQAFMQAHVEANGFMGTVLVARGDQVLHRAGYGMADLEQDTPATPQTIFRLASLTKQFTAAAILQLQDQGRLSVADPVSAYLPDYPEGEAITLHQLLNHTAGLPDYEQFPDQAALRREAVSVDQLIARFADLPLEFTPGSQFSYSNSGYAVLTRIIETVSGQTYAEYLAEHIFQPLGMAATGYEDWAMVLPHRAEGYVLNEDVYRRAEFMDMSNAAGAGGLYSTVSDFYRWNRALDDGRLLSEAARQAMFAPATGPAATAGYAYGWGVANVAGRDFVLHGGEVNGASTFVIRDPAQALLVLVLSNVEGIPADAIAFGLAAIALGDPYALPPKHTAIELDPAVFERYVGRYQVGPNLIATISMDAGHYYAQTGDNPQIELLPSSETKFFATTADIEVHFQVGPDGMVTGLTIQQGGQTYEAARIE
jgi:CubicO group peptidase (beta-lactamase class C family)